MEFRDRIIELRRIPACDLKPHPLNWRTHPAAQTSALRDVLTEIGFAGAELAFPADGLGPDGNFDDLMLIDGHARKDLAGQSVIPVLVTDLTAAEALKLLATYDPLGAMATADAAKLDELLRSVEFTSEAVAAMLAELAEESGVLDGMAGEVVEDEVPEPPVDPITKPGDLWLLGSHRLLCGDSTKAESVGRLMGGEKAALCFTSPPYGQQRDYTAEGKAKVSDWDGLMQGVFANLQMTDEGQVLVNLGMIHRDGEWIPYWDSWIEWMREQGWRRFGWYVWDQGSGLPGDWNGRLGPSHEFIFHFNREGVRPEKWAECDPLNVEIGKRATAKRKSGKSVTSMRGKDGTVKSVSSTERNSHKIPDSVIRISRCATIDMARENHPATFPIQFPAFGIQSWPGTAYEPFCGSGSTLIAAEQLGRKCYGMEISPAYCDVIVKRWETLTGKKATLA